MKIIIFGFLTMILFFAYGQKSPTIVSKEQSNRNVLIEEFTAKNCGNCPCGHRIVNDLKVANPNKIWAINIHSGSLAAGTPNYTTTFGNMYTSKAGVSGYPNGSVNRLVFKNSTTAMSISNLEGAADSVMKMLTPVNVATKIISLDEQTRELKILVEVYYTANADSAENFINLAVVQNDIFGPQEFVEDCLYPENMVGMQYKHSHMLRHMITGTWGNKISTTSAETFWDSTYTYVIPESYGSIPVVLDNLEFIAFVTESKQNVLNCHGVKAVDETSIEKNELKFNVKIYPIPASDIVNMDVETEKNMRSVVEIFNVVGMRVFFAEEVFSTGKNVVKINTSDFDNGTYFIKINGENGVLTSKFSVSK